MLDNIDQDLLKAAMGLFAGDEQSALRWLQKPERALGGKKPIDVEISEVLRLIGQIEYGVVP
ncbi:antitoxin Xre/MbcA/ParS toxin-binding domain-containing protein [Pseudomonas sp. NA-150]|uniref:antitoxin Xre/MbcA/ParS toxin-binding domain-containing protein n=1 Tax=Pseudomonas sp. NA-150 TaxID=3367525 RepID=UPI0037C7D2A4